MEGLGCPFLFQVQLSYRRLQAQSQARKVCCPENRFVREEPLPPLALRQSAPLRQVRPQEVQRAGGPEDAREALRARQVALLLRHALQVRAKG